LLWKNVANVILKHKKNVAADGKVLICAIFLCAKGFDLCGFKKAIS